MTHCEKCKDMCDSQCPSCGYYCTCGNKFLCKCHTPLTHIEDSATIGGKLHKILNNTLQRKLSIKEYGKVVTLIAQFGSSQKARVEMQRDTTEGDSTYDLGKEAGRKGEKARVVELITALSAVHAPVNGLCSSECELCDGYNQALSDLLTKLTNEK